MITAIVNHLWQSSVIGLAAWLVAFTLRRNGAGVRHAVWLVASLKFLLPFSLLIGLGGALSWRTAAGPVTTTAPAIVQAVQTITEPFAQPAPVPLDIAATPRTAAMDWPLVLAIAWLGGFLIVVAMRVRGWQRVRAGLRASTSVALPGVDCIRVRATPGLLEPGVVGIWRPLLLVPIGIETTLTPEQLRAVVAHELHHIRRRDNLTSALHMAVEAVFWFHPLVWWIGARLIDERERACDEYVIASGASPDAYAEGILNVCKRYVESPVVFVAGVTGSDLKKRVAGILAQRVGTRLTTARRALLVAAAMAALAVPVAAGMLAAPRLAPRQTASAFPRFDVVSVRPCAPGAAGQARARADGTGGGPITSPGRLYLQCYPLSTMLSEAYLYFADGRAHGLDAVITVRVEGGPDWMKTDRFTIEARTDQNPAPAVMRGPMLQAVLEDRFKLKLHSESREMPIYELVISKTGAKVSPYTGNDCVIRDAAAWPPPTLPTGQRYCGDRSTVDGDRFIRTGVMTLDELVALFAFDRPVVNRTGITAPVSYRYDYPKDAARVGDAPPASMVKAIRDQLGLDLRPSKGPRRFLVIDHAERPDSASADAPASAGPAASTSSASGSTGADQKFEVASIRPCTDSSGPRGGRSGGAGAVLSPGLFVYNCSTLIQMIYGAYVTNGTPLLNNDARMRNAPDLIRGGPDWTRSERFMVEAKTATSTGAQGPLPAPEQALVMGPMLRALLEERFTLKLHREVEHSAAMYALTISTTGLKFTLAGPDSCTPVGASQPASGVYEEIDRVRRGGKPICGRIVSVEDGPNRIAVLGGLTMKRIADALSAIVGRRVLDQTGADGQFTMFLEYAPTDLAPSDRAAGAATNMPTAPALAEALKSFGLGLQPTTGSKEYLVIDHAERPTMDAQAASRPGAPGSR